MDEEKKKLKLLAAEKKKCDAEAIAKKISDRKLRIDSLRIKFPDEPVEGSAGLLKVSIRLPSGMRIIRKFCASDSVQVRILILIFDFS